MADVLVGLGVVVVGDMMPLHVIMTVLATLDELHGLDACRVAGNSGVHLGEEEAEDALAILPVEVVQVDFLRVVDLLVVLLARAH